jgi:hypothetical protein
MYIIFIYFCTICTITNTNNYSKDLLEELDLWEILIRMNITPDGDQTEADDPWGSMQDGKFLQ